MSFISAVVLTLLSMASPVRSPNEECWVFPALPGRNELLWGGCAHQNVAQASPGAPAGEGLVPVCYQRCLCCAPARQPHWCGQQGLVLAGSASPWMAPLETAYLVVKARDSASRGGAPEIETFAHEQVAPPPPPCLTLDILPTAKGAPAEHQVLLQPHAVQPLHLPDGGPDPPGLCLRR